ncbi:MAG: hypothetical protein ACYC0J_05805 [Gammaproteobacteria bacterium]
MKYQSIHEHELEKFKNKCEECKYNYDDFTLEEHDVTSHPTGTGSTVKGKVTITKNGISKTYETGYEKSWVEKAGEDIFKGIFG